MEANSLLITFLAQMGVISFALTFCSFVRDRVRGKQSAWRLIVSGLFFGGAAALLMNMSGELIDGFRFDLRIVPLAIVGLIAGPIGAIMAACTASAARLWLGGAGTALGLLGIWLACLVSISGHLFLKRGYIRPSDVLLFSTLNAGIAFLILLVLPQTVRTNLSQFNAQYSLLALNFVGTLISASFVRLDQMRRESAHLNELHSQIVSALPDALSVKDLDGRFLIANDPTAVLMGATDGVAMVGKTDFDYYNPEEAALFWKQEQEFLADPKPVVLEQQFSRNGQTYWLSTIKAPYRDESGELKGICWFPRRTEPVRRIISIEN
ncbi:LytS/YhcK type 5TM receptor domain-containing protein [Ciceribacter selenitireducens]|uniref:PAS domain-containing protein n=1 Tax=Ciceribacter selenitireducens ATCC BAA-1503 TaxID=1336235 RepID=A0A380TM35_9HYPH|nr:LytS/YhcK type 5TM receptor domain-containing protein [Ciceribacter selenitireducens]SUS16600.1 unnamed protein product [Ciceribacter selenitireducens ATCC BAA-1503]